MCKLSLAVASRATLHSGAQAFCCSPISCCRPQAPSAQAQSLQCSGLCSTACGISGSRGQICVSYIDRRIIIHTVPPGKSLFQDLHTCSSLPLSSSPILAAPPSSLSNVTSLGTSSSSNQTSNVGAHSTFQPHVSSSYSTQSLLLLAVSTCSHVLFFSLTWPQQVRKH